MQQRLVVAGLEFVGTNQETIGIFLDLVGNLAGGKTVEGGFGDFDAPVLMFTGEGDDGQVSTFAFAEIVAESIEILDGTFDAAGNQHGPSLTANLIQGQYLLVEVIHHDLCLELDRVLMAFHVAA